jgi:hypothetical protein
MPQISTAEEALAIVNQLPAEEQARLIGLVAQNLVKHEPPHQPGRPFRGILAHLGPAPSAEEIDEVRRDMMQGFAEGDDW